MGGCRSLCFCFLLVILAITMAALAGLKEALTSSGLGVCCGECAKCLPLSSWLFRKRPEDCLWLSLDFLRSLAGKWNRDSSVFGFPYFRAALGAFPGLP